MALFALIREKGLQRRIAPGRRSSRWASSARALLRRRHAHAGDLGAVGGGGHRGGRAEPARARGADHAGDRGRAVRDPAPRHRAVGRCSRRSWGCGSAARGRGPAEIVKHPGPARDVAHLRGRVLFAGHVAFLALGSVVLAFTGAEALYADMGHFGRHAISRAWFFVVFPALMLNYVGQASLILHGPRRSEPLLSPDPGLVAGADDRAGDLRDFDRLAGGHLGRVLGDPAGRPARLPPALKIRHTSRETGQVYLPAVNWGMFVLVVVLVLGFGSSSQTRDRLRHRRHRHAPDRLDPVPHRRRVVWRKPRWRSPAGSRSCRRPRVPRRQPPEDHTRRLVPARVGAVVFLLLTTWQRRRVTDARAGSRARCAASSRRSATAEAD